MIKTNTQIKRILILIFASAFLSTILFYLLFGFNAVNPQNDEWIYHSAKDNDIMQHYAGWVFYRNADFQFPLGQAIEMQYPSGVGATLSFTDSIPIAGVFFKLFSALLPQTFQYFGIWALLCYVLMGVGSCLLLSLFLKDTIAQNIACVIGSGLFVISPVMADRAFRHSALASHFLIIFALYLYFYAKKYHKPYNFAWYGLCALAVCIHPYFLPIVFAVLFALLLEITFDAKKLHVFIKSLLFLMGCIAITCAFGFVIGVFNAPAGVNLDYGFWSMNLNSVFNPQAVSANYSRVISALPLTNGNIDGFNYWGIGILIAFFIGFVIIAFKRRDILKKLIKQYYGLLFSCFALTIFAITNVVTLFDKTLLTVPLPQNIVEFCSIFRASGRMFWLVDYLAILCVCLFCAKLFKNKERKKHVLYSNLLLVLVFVVQIWDVSHGFAQHKSAVDTLETKQIDFRTDALWQEFSENYEHMFSMDNRLDYTYELALWVAQSEMTTNDLFTARFDEWAHQDEVSLMIENFKTGIYDENTMYLTCDFDKFQTLAEICIKQNLPVDCVQINDIWYAVLPQKENLNLNMHNNIIYYPNFPTAIAVYNDALWTNGVLNSDKRIILLYDNLITNALLSDNNYISDGDNVYEILKEDYKDEGWVMVTIDIDDASVLVGKDLIRG